LRIKVTLPTLAVTKTRIRVRAFARIRELLGSDVLDVELLAPARVSDVADVLRERLAQNAQVLRATKFARNGRLANLDDELLDGDEVALLPPVGGG